jgi:hypothetical protein
MDLALPKNNWCFITFLGVDVEFQRAQYFEMETTATDVCVMVSRGSLQRNVNISIQSILLTQDDDAGVFPGTCFTW